MSNLPEFIFDAVNGPLIFISSGSVKSSVYITECGSVGFGGVGTSSVDSAISASYATSTSFAVSASYAPVPSTSSWSVNSITSSIARTASYFNTSDIVQFTASYGQITDLSVYHLRSIPGYDTIIVDAPIDVTGSFYGTSSVSINSTSASYIPASGIDAFKSTRDGTGAGGLLLVEHFLAPTTALINAFASTVSGTGAAVTIATGSAGHPGVIQQSTGTTATGRTSTVSQATCILLGSGTYVYEAVVKLPILSVAAQRYTFYVGFGGVSGAGDMTNGVYFQYTDSASTYWQIKTAGASTRSTTTTATTVTAGAWYKLRIVVTNTVSADFYINDVLVGTITTNIPAVTGRETGVIVKIEKSIGITASTSLIDFIKVAYR